MTIDNLMTNPNNRYYSLLQIGKKMLGWDEDTYRTFLLNHGATEKAGRISASSMAPGELKAAVQAMEAQGFVRTRKTVLNTNNWRTPRLKKITALWCALADAGVVNSKSERAMHKFCRGIMSADKIQWASSQDLNKCIEALKGWAHRESVSIQ